MPGFAFYNRNITASTKKSGNLLYERMVYSDIVAERNTLNKYLGDKLFFQNDKYMVILDGVILNKTALCEKTGQDWIDTFVLLYETHGIYAPAKLRGSFCGLIYEKQSGKVFVFVDQLGERTLYYSTLRERILVSCDYFQISDQLTQEGESLTLNKDACYSMLVYAHMCDENTYVNEIKRLLGGEYLVFEGGTVKKGVYYELTSDKFDLSKATEEEMVEELNTRFKEGMTLAVKKDREYNYKTAIELSGGMDSRLNAFVLKDIVEEPPLAICFSKADNADHIVSEKIANDLGFEYFFKELDNAQFMKYLEECVSMNFGSTYYFGSAHSLSLLKSLHESRLGLIVNGVLGDVGDGSYILNFDKYARVRTYRHKAPTAILYPYDYKLAGKVNKNHLKRYPNEEIYMMLNRGVMGILSFNHVKQYFSESYTAYGYLEYLEYAMSIPPYYRTRKNIYKTWALKYYPDMDKYPYKDKKFSSKNHPYIMLFKRAIKSIKYRLCKILKIKEKNKIIVNHQNPFDYWYQTSKDVKSFMDGYFSESIKSEVIPHELRADMEMLYENKCINKAQVLTALAVIRRIWGIK